MATINITDDPVFDAEAYEEAREEEWQRFVRSTPVCSECRRHVAEVDDYYYELDTDVFLCESCMRKKMRCIK